MFTDAQVLPNVICLGAQTDQRESVPSPSVKNPIETLQSLANPCTIEKSAFCLGAIRMAYIGELGAGVSIYIENQDGQTVVTAVAASPGQQQQTSHSFTTGSWTTSPELFRSVQGTVIKVRTARGDFYLQVLSQQIGQIEAPPPGQTLEPIPLQQVAQTPTTPIPPMPPMPNMAMSMQPMQMRMGNMHMSMGTASAATSTTQHKFCSQCGTAIETADKFCANCGHSLK